MRIHHRQPFCPLFLFFTSSHGQDSVRQHPLRLHQPSHPALGSLGLAPRHESPRPTRRPYAQPCFTPWPIFPAALPACVSNFQIGQLHLVGSSVSSCAPSACDTGSSYLSDSSVLRAAVKALHRASLPAVPSYQRRPSSQRNREGNVRFSNESARGWSLRDANV